MQDIKVTLVQTCLYWGDRTKNLRNIESKILGLDTDLIVLPEMFSTAFITTKLYTVAEVMFGPTFNWMLKTASNMNTTIVGSVIIRENNEYFNRLIWMPPDGEYKIYDKRHLFRMADEDKQFTMGSEKIITNLKGWNFLPLICYDLRFPVWSKNLYFNNKFQYDALIYIANFPAQRQHAWNSLLMARAIENQSFVIGVNRVGTDKFNSYKGESQVVDPQGKQTLVLQKDNTATIELKYSDLEEYRKNFNVALDWDKFTIS